MPTTVLPKFSAAAPLTITLAGLANSAAGVGRQGTIVDNSTSRYERITVYARVKLGTSPSASALVKFFLIRDDGSGTPNRTDNAGASDAGITLTNALPVGTLISSATAATGDVLQGSFVVENPGPKWTLAAVNSTGVALDATGGNHVINWVGSDLEIQN